jgi:hypothetical protein
VAPDAAATHSPAMKFWFGIVTPAGRPGRGLGRVATMLGAPDGSRKGIRRESTVS